MHTSHEVPRPRMTAIPAEVCHDAYGVLSHYHYNTLSSQMPRTLGWYYGHRVVTVSLVLIWTGHMMENSLPTQVLEGGHDS